MKALIRHKNETIKENDKIDVNWNTGAPLTNSDWVGGPYRLIEDYSTPSEDVQNNDVELEPFTDRKAEIAILKARLAALENEI